jgi:hypothetical protein
MLFVSRLSLKIQAIDVNVPKKYVLPNLRKYDVRRTVCWKLAAIRHNNTV